MGRTVAELSRTVLAASRPKGSGPSRTMVPTLGPAVCRRTHPPGWAEPLRNRAVPFLPLPARKAADHRGRWSLHWVLRFAVGPILPDGPNRYGTDPYRSYRFLPGRKRTIGDDGPYIGSSGLIQRNTVYLPSIWRDSPQYMSISPDNRFLHGSHGHRSGAAIGLSHIFYC